MLREDVGIILNEREAAKAKIAELLELRFKSLSITVSRIPVDKHAAAVIRARPPRVLVVDYLLGDVTTGLDILAALSDLPVEERPVVVFLTDEPSIAVAVQALKGGAVDYLEIDSPHAVQQVTTLAERILRENQQRHRPRREIVTDLDDLVAGAPTIQQTLRALRAAIIRRERGIVLYGATGTGLTTLARGAAALLENPGAWSYIDLTTFLDTPLDLPGITTDSRGGIRPSPEHTLIIDHAENDDGEILGALSNGFAREPGASGRLLVCTNDEYTARAFVRTTGGVLIPVPSLLERRTDVGPLAQRFIKEAEILIGKRIDPLNSATILDLAERTWPANVRQLRTVVLNTALDSLRAEIPTTESIAAHYTVSCEGVLDTTGEDSIDPLIAARTFEATGRHYRRTAARLGCSIAVIQRALGLSGASGGVTP